MYANLIKNSFYGDYILSFTILVTICRYLYITLMRIKIIVSGEISTHVFQQLQLGALLLSYKGSRRQGDYDTLSIQFLDRTVVLSIKKHFSFNLISNTHHFKARCRLSFKANSICSVLIFVGYPKSVKKPYCASDVIYAVPRSESEKL